MTYDQLLAFLAVAREGGFTTASSRLAKSQPAVSKLVRNLEGELGLALFDRGQYRATLTDAGRVFAERAAAVIEETEGLRSFGLQLAGGVEPIVRLAVEAVTPLAPIMATLRVLQAHHPAVRFELSTERLAGAAAALREGRVDLAVATTLGTTPGATETAPYRRVRILPVVRADHPLAAGRGAVQRPRLRAVAQIVLRDSTQDPEALSLNVLEGGLRWTVTDVAAKKEVILAGMGWGGLPEHLVASEIARGELAVLRIPEFATDAMELVVMRRRDRARGVVAQALWEALARPPEPPPAGVVGRARRAPTHRGRGVGR